MIDFDPFSAATIRDPYPVYQQLRAEEPLHWSERWNLWVISRYEDVRAVIQDDRFSARHTVEQLGVLPEVELGVFARVPTLPSTDPPRHTRLRKLINRAFTHSSVQRMAPQIEAIVDAALSEAAERGHLNVVADLANPLPIRVIAGMLGVKPEDAPLFKGWSDELMVAFEGDRASAAELDAASKAVESIDEYLRTATRSREAGDTDLLALLRYVADGGEHLSEDEIVATGVLLLVAGNETTTSLIVNGLLALLENPDQLARLRANPDLVPSGVEEMLRYYGPVHLMLRSATEDIEIAGGLVRKGQSVSLLLGSADRDERQFPDGGHFLVDRSPNDHVAFGRNRHFCLGAPLARLESQLAYRGLLRHLSDFHLDGTRTPRWRGSLQARRVDEISLDVTSAA